MSHYGTENQRPSMGPGQPLLLSVRCSLRATLMSVPFTSLPSQVGCELQLYECGEHELLRATRTWMDCTSAIHRDWSAAVCRDAAVSCLQGCRHGRLEAQSYKFSSPQFDTVVSCQLLILNQMLNFVSKAQRSQRPTGLRSEI